MEGSFTCSEGTTGAGTGQIDTLQEKKKQKREIKFTHLFYFEYHWIKVDLGKYLGKALTEGSLNWFWGFAKETNINNNILPEMKYGS